MVAVTFCLLKSTCFGILNTFFKMLSKTNCITEVQNNDRLLSRDVIVVKIALKFLSNRVKDQ